MLCLWWTLNQLIHFYHSCDVCIRVSGITLLFYMSVFHVAESQRISYMSIVASMAKVLYSLL